MSVFLDIVRMVTALGSAAAAIASVVAAWHGWRNAQAIQQVHLSVNSRLDQWLAATAASAFARGQKDHADSASEG